MTFKCFGILTRGLSFCWQNTGKCNWYAWQPEVHAQTICLFLVVRNQLVNAFKCRSSCNVICTTAKPLNQEMADTLVVPYRNSNISCTRPTLSYNVASVAIHTVHEHSMSFHSFHLTKIPSAIIIMKIQLLQNIKHIQYNKYECYTSGS